MSGQHCTHSSLIKVTWTNMMLSVSGWEFDDEAYIDLIRPNFAGELKLRPIVTRIISEVVEPDRSVTENW